MKIVDCFLFYNELDLLKFKLKELNEVIDYFVIIESKFTFVGNEKELYYENNKELFTEYADKIVHVIHDHNATAETGVAWSNEKEQRFWGTKGVAQLNLNDDDIVILSDLDEIADKNTLKKFREEGLTNPISCLEQDMYYYNLTNKTKEKCYHSKIIRYDRYSLLSNASPDDMANIDHCPDPRGLHIGNYPIIHKGGWHFSFFGGSSMIKNKIKNFSHTELSHFGDEDDDKINEKIQNNKDIFDRENMKFEFIDILNNDYLPENYEMLL